MGIIPCPMRTLVTVPRAFQGHHHTCLEPTLGTAWGHPWISTGKGYLQGPKGTPKATELHILPRGLLFVGMQWKQWNLFKTFPFSSDLCTLFSSVPNKLRARNWLVFPAPNNSICSSHLQSAYLCQILFPVAVYINTPNSGQQYLLLFQPDSGTGLIIKTSRWEVPPLVYWPLKDLLFPFPSSAPHHVGHTVQRDKIKCPPGAHIPPLDSQ